MLKTGKRLSSCFTIALSMLILPTQTTMAEEGGRNFTEEIIVTATKRETSVQDIPIAVSAFTGEDLDARGVQDLYGLQEVSPSISVYSSNSTSNGGTVRIRGVGTTGNNPGLEAAVGTFIDGIYRSRAGQAFSDLVDIERIEILRGPQGSLFGKNTSAGALQIITKKPEFERNSMVALSMGEYDALRVQASTTGPLVDDKLAYRFAVNYHERDGYQENDINSDAYDSRDRWSVKGQLLWEGDSWDNRVILDYAEKDEDCCPANYQFMNFTRQADSSTTRGVLNLGVPPGTIVNSLLAELGRPQQFGGQPKSDNEVGVNFDPFENTEDWGIQNDFSMELNDRMSLKSITAYREFKVARGQDIDFSGADILRPQFTNEKFENFSQEFQLTFSGDNADYLFGLYYYTEDIVTDEEIRLATQGGRYLSQLIVGAAFGDALGNTSVAPFNTTRGSGGIGTFDIASGTYLSDGAVRPNFQEGDGYFADYAQDTEGWSLFTHNTWHVTDQWDISFGARYSNEEKKASTRINGVDPIAGISERDLLARMLNNDFDEDHCNGLVFIGALCNNVSWTDKNTEKEWSGTIQVSYAVNEDMNIYASASRGYKAGGFNLDQSAIEMDIFAMWLATGGDARFLAESGLAGDIPQAVLDATGGTGRNGLTQFPCGQATGTANPGIAQLDCAFFDDDHAFDPEFVDAYEIGMKGKFLDGKLTTNVALFYSDFDDFQLNTFTGTGFLISNTNKMVSKGFEFESMYNLTDGVYWTLGVTYANAKYGKNLNADTSEAALFLAQDYDTLEDWSALEDIEGKRITQAPKWQGSTSLFVEQPFGDTFVYGNVNVAYRGPNNTGSDLNPIKDIDGEVLVNLQVGVRSASDRWDVQFWARNLFDNQVNTLIFNSVFQSGSFSTFFGPQRMVGGTVRMHF